MPLVRVALDQRLHEIEEHKGGHQSDGHADHVSQCVPVVCASVMAACACERQEPRQSRSWVEHGHSSFRRQMSIETDEDPKRG